MPRRNQAHARRRQSSPLEQKRGSQNTPDSPQLELESSLNASYLDKDPEARTSSPLAGQPKKRTGKRILDDVSLGILLPSADKIWDRAPELGSRGKNKRQTIPCWKALFSHFPSRYHSPLSLPYSLRSGALSRILSADG